MTATPMPINSGANPYCTGAQFVTIYDWRSFAQLASDTDVPIASQAALESNPVLAAQLSIAAGLIEMAATVSARYDPVDLTALAAGTTNGAYALIEMNAALAAAGMYKRRFEALPPEIQATYEVAMAKLSALESGEAIFGFGPTQQAGLLHDYKETPNDVWLRHMPSTVAHRCLGRRDNRRYPQG